MLKNLDKKYLFQYKIVLLNTKGCQNSRERNPPSIVSSTVPKAEKKNWRFLKRLEMVGENTWINVSPHLITNLLIEIFIGISIIYFTYFSTNPHG